MPHNPSYYFQRDITKPSSSAAALPGDKIRRHKSEYLDDIRAQCGGLRNVADCIEKAAAKLDRDRQAGKAWDSGAVMRELTKADNILTRLSLTAERMTE